MPGSSAQKRLKEAASMRFIDGRPQWRGPGDLVPAFNAKVVRLLPLKAKHSRYRRRFRTEIATDPWMEI